MNCYRCNANDRDYFKVGIEGDRGVTANMELCDECAQELKAWLCFEPLGMVAQIKALEAMAAKQGG